MSERVKIILDKNADILRLPAIALRGLVVFPGNIIHFEVGRKKSIAAIEWAMNNNNAVFVNNVIRPLIYILTVNALNRRRCVCYRVTIGRNRHSNNKVTICKFELI